MLNNILFMISYCLLQHKCISFIILSLLEFQLAIFKLILIRISDQPLVQHQVEQMCNRYFINFQKDFRKIEFLNLFYKIQIQPTQHQNKSLLFMSPMFQSPKWILLLFIFAFKFKPLSLIQNLHQIQIISLLFHKISFSNAILDNSSIFHIFTLL